MRNVFREDIHCNVGVSLVPICVEKHSMLWVNGDASRFLQTILFVEDYPTEPMADGVEVTGRRVHRMLALKQSKISTLVLYRPMAELRYRSSALLTIFKKRDIIETGC